MGKFRKIPKKKSIVLKAGNYVARCYSIVDIGTQKWNGKYGKQAERQIRITWELPSEMVVFSEEKGKQPTVIGKDYNWVFGRKANLRKILEGWRGRRFTEKELVEFDEEKILGIPCMLNIVHDEKPTGTYAVIDSASPLPKEIECPEQINETINFCMEDFKCSDILEFPEWIQKKIKSSPEWLKQERKEKREQNKTEASEEERNKTDTDLDEINKMLSDK